MIDHDRLYKELLQTPQKERDLMEWMSSYTREGFQKGLTEGKIEGKIEGEKESLEKVAMRMLEEGLAPDLIAKITGLSESDIDKLRKSH